MTSRPHQGPAGSARGSPADSIPPFQELRPQSTRPWRASGHQIRATLATFWSEACVVSTESRVCACSDRSLVPLVRIEDSNPVSVAAGSPVDLGAGLGGAQAIDPV